MAPVCASFGFRSKVQSTEATWVKLDFWWSYSRWVLWKTKFTFAAKSSFAGWVASVREDALVRHGFPVMRERSCGCRWDQPVLPLGHRSCRSPRGRCSLGFHRAHEDHQSGTKIKLTKVAEVWFPSNNPAAPSLLWAGWDFAMGRRYRLQFMAHLGNRWGNKRTLRTAYSGLIQQWCACHLCCRMSCSSLEDPVEVAHVLSHCCFSAFALSLSFILSLESDHS